MSLMSLSARRCSTGVTPGVPRRSMRSLVTFALVTARSTVVVVTTGAAAARLAGAPSVRELEPPQAPSATAPPSAHTMTRAATCCTRATLCRRESARSSRRLHPFLSSVRIGTGHRRRAACARVQVHASLDWRDAPAC